MMAPYMIGYFEPESLIELTVSWWTEEMELEGLKKDPDWKGETPAIKLKLNDDGNFIQFRTEGTNFYNDELVYANDDYAIENPTIVFGNFRDERIIDPEEGWSGGGGNNNPDPNITSPVCSELNESDIIVVRMPEIQLDGNIRRWPNPNYMFMWVATGSFEVGSNGLPQISGSVNHPINELKVTRSQANKNNWVSSKSSFIISNWKIESDNAYVVWACTRTKAEIDVEGTIKVSEKEGASFERKVKVAIRNSVELVSAMSFDKCFVLFNNRNQRKQGNLPLRNGNPVYEFNKVRSYFEIEKLQ